MDNYEEMKEKIIEELKKEYTLTPIKESRFSVSDILDKYYDDIIIKCNAVDTWSSKQAIGNGIRKVVAMHFGYINLTNVNSEDRVKIREELERFIKEYILGGK